MTDCDDFMAVVNAVLDGDAAASELTTGHPLACRDCRELAAAARLLAAPGLRVSPMVPAGLTSRLVAATARRRRPWVPALAACLAVAGGVWLSRPAVGPAAADVATRPTARPTTAPRVADQWAAVTTVARHAGEQAAAPARLLALPSASPAPPAPDALASLGQASKVAAAPVADAARRAVGLFRRDFGPSAKPAG